LKSQRFTGVLLACLATATVLAQAPAISLRVDLTDAPRKLIHSTEILPVAPGPLTLVYPKWIPGEHAPTGPIENMAGFTISALGPNGAVCATDSRVKWERDPVDMYAFHLTVPPGCAALTIHLDFLGTAPATGFSAGASMSENLAMLSWNTVLVYPQGSSPAALTIAPSIALPSAWQFGTALRRKPTSPSNDPVSSVAFDPVSLEMLIDSPVLAGKYFKEIPLAPDVTPKHYLDMVADGPEDLNLPAARIDNFSRLVRETGALYQSRHYADYHFLVTLSDSVAHFGLEHHQSSDDRVAPRTFIDADQFILDGDLLPHEFTHSWNGKYRRPAGLATSDYQQPMIGDLLWVYEGLTQYFGDVLAVRSGLWTPEQYRGMLAGKAAQLDNWPGRTWRDLQDTATMAQVLYGTGGGWESWRRNVDYYPEGDLLWLDVDTTIRKLSGDKKSLNDFAAAFESLGGNTPPRVVPYTFNDIVAALNAVVPNDWAAFLHQRLDSNAPGAPLGGIENGGYKLTYQPRPNPWDEMQNTQNGSFNFWYSLGLHVDGGGTLTDVLKGGPADKSALGPGMRLVAVNGRGFTPALLRAAVNDAEGTNAPPIELIVENAGYYSVIKVDYHGGERYPILERVPNTPDTLDEILQPLVPPAR
jgi:predicted metalloprotease with PDZ domain